ADESLPLHLVAKGGLDAFVERLDPAQRAWVRASAFKAGLGEVLAVPGPDGAPALALVGYGDAEARRRSRFGLASARADLPDATYHLVSDLDGMDLNEAALGWLLAGYRFTRYHDAPA